MKKLVNTILKNLLSLGLSESDLNKVKEAVHNSVVEVSNKEKQAKLEVMMTLKDGKQETIKWQSLLNKVAYSKYNKLYKDLGTKSKKEVDEMVNVVKKGETLTLGHRTFELAGKSNE